MTKENREMAKGRGNDQVMVICHILKTGSTYQDLSDDYFDKLNKNRLVPYLVMIFKNIGFRVTLEAA